MPVFESVLEHTAEPVLSNDTKPGAAVLTEISYLQDDLTYSSGPSGPSSDASFENTTCIVGMACHLPGGITSPSGLWDYLYNKKSAQCKVPLQRYNVEGFYGKDNIRAGIMNVDGGYFLDEDVRQFDASFFGINNLEASYMDPQQRKLLEIVYECLENAGETMQDIAGTNTAVYVGNFTVDYNLMQSRDSDYLHRLAATGSGTSIMSNRISHVFDLRGPSFTLDTACSSTIYAMHQAVTAIKNGDCDAAIVAGANLITSPEQHFGTAKGGFLSPTSACHTFDVSADGYARAEALNAIYIKRLSSTLKKDGKVHAVIRGTAINSNGRTPGITLPDAKMQEAVIRKAYQNAGLSFSDTDYVECHGTGTPVGDPIEVDGIAACFASREGEPLRIGSVKTNMGHGEAASGLTSVIKVALAFEHGVIPPTYGVKEVNPKLKLKERNMKVLCDNEAWPRSLQRASVNSFGYGGANGHVILESINSYMNDTTTFPSFLPLSNKEESRGEVLVLPFSASSGMSLDDRRSQTSGLIQKAANAETLTAITMALSKRQTGLRLRDYVLASAGSKPALIDMADNGDKATPGAKPLPFAFVFTGQGAQYPNMGKELVEQDAAFLATIRELDVVLASLPAEYRPDWTLEQTLLDGPTTSKINEVTRSQPICTAVQIALADLLRSWGVEPSAVIGHSSGEIAASYSAGLLTSAQAIQAAYFRGFAVGQLQSRGTMVAAGITADAANAMIERLGFKEVRVACVNAPESVTLSGATSDIEALLVELQGEGKFARKLETGDRAYHSHMMAEIGDLYESLVTPHFADKTEASNLEVKMFSTVGRSAEALSVVKSSTNMASYFRQNLEQPVQFSGGLTKMITADKYHLVELGPHSALKGPIQQIRTAAKRDKESAPYSPTLVRKENAYICLKKLAGTLYSYGHSVKWSVVNSPPKSTKLPTPNLPSYPWDYSKPLLWHEPRGSIEHRLRKHPRHELLGTRITAGNGIEYFWRNIPKMSEIAWVCDHKLGESQVVLPGAAYMAIAIEALSQIQDIKNNLKAGDAYSFEFENVNISAAFVVPEESHADAERMELHTVMNSRKISTANKSKDWHDFSISSWITGVTTLHCMGSIRAVDSVMKVTDGAVEIYPKGYECWPMGRWYTKAKEEGLNFGPYFQSLTSLYTDGNRTATESIGTTVLDPPSAASAGMFYAIHPITIDACFQAAIFGGTAGNVSTLRAFVPVFLTNCTIQLPKGGAVGQGVEEMRIHSRMEKTGFASRAVSFTLRLPDGTPCIDMRHMRLNAYTGKAPVAPETSMYLQRQPCLRIEWKPDALRAQIGSERALNDYIFDFATKQSDDMKDNGTLVVFAAVLDLLAHKVPRMAVLELGQERQWSAKDVLSILGKDTAFPRCKSWNEGAVSETGEIIIEDAKKPDAFDAVVIPHHSVSRKVWAELPERIVEKVSENGIVITRKNEAAISSLNAAGFTTIELPSDSLLAIRGPKQTGLEGKSMAVVKPNQSSPVTDALASAICAHFKKLGVAQVDSVAIGDIEAADLNENVVVVSLLEVEEEFLATVSSDDMDRFRKITDNVTSLLWLTGANMLSAPKPDLTLSSGLSRALMLEQPALRYAILDIGADASKSSLVAAICANVSAALTFRYATDDSEFIQMDGVLYTSRFVPDVELNAQFRQRMGTEDMAMVPFGEVGPARLSVGQVGMTDTIHFQQTSERQTAPPVGFVDVDLRSVGLNAKDIYAINGRADTRDCTVALDFGGVVRETGPGVTHLKKGDRVAAFVPNHFSTTERVRVETLHKLLPEEDITVMPTILGVNVTAFVCLRDRAHLRPGETVLIHSGAGAFGLAAINIAQLMGATVYTTVGSQLKRDYLTKEMGVPAENIFNSRDDSFVEGIMGATGGRGINVIINSLVGDLMHASWSCIAPFGRFVEIGKRELIDAGSLDMHKFLQGSTFSAFDLSEFFYAEDPHYQKVVYDYTTEVVEMYRAGKIKASPIATFDVAQMGQAYRYFNNKDRIGKVVISMENLKSKVPVVPPTYQSVFSPEKTYLLVGCLGGLGRSLSRWMMSRGARRFCFLGRSGTDKPSAAELVNRLRDAGAQVTVVRGDVSNEDQVREAVAAATKEGPVGGVVQAAMGLSEALFTSMTNKAWHTGIQPKWRGSWNIHNALNGHDEGLDFFVMTSSISGSCGTATESNYCSANGFLDGFARWRRSQGKPAVSVGLGMISEVGYLHENPEIEAMLLRKGIQPLNEEEFLQVLDYGIAGPGGDAEFASGKPLGIELAHILTGLESYGVRKLMAQGFEVNNGVMDESRTSILAASLLAEKDEKTEEESGVDGSLEAAAEWVKDIPASAVQMFMSEASAPTMLDATLRLIKKRFSNLILMQLDAVDERAPLPSFGVDSMLAAEFRTWLFNAFKVDIPFLDIISPQKCLYNLAEFIEEKLVASWTT